MKERPAKGGGTGLHVNISVHATKQRRQLVEKLLEAGWGPACLYSLRNYISQVAIPQRAGPNPAFSELDDSATWVPAWVIAFILGYEAEYGEPIQSMGVIYPAFKERIELLAKDKRRKVLVIGECLLRFGSGLSALEIRAMEAWVSSRK